ACGKYRGVQHQGMICDHCGVKLTRSRVRRQRMGHLELAAPVVHFWALRSPYGLSALLGLDRADLEKVVIYQAFAVIDPGDTHLREKQLIGLEELRDARARRDPGFEAGIGAAAIRRLLERLDLDVAIAEARQQTPAEAVNPRRLRTLEAVRDAGLRDRLQWLV